MSRNRSLRKKSRFNSSLRVFADLCIVGLGIGVIAGTTIKTIAIQSKNGQIIVPNSINPKMTTTRDISKMRSHNSKLVNHNFISQINIKNGNEIKELSKEWEAIAGKESDLKASGFLLVIDDQRYAQISENAILPAASSIKIPILITVLKLIDSGELNWNEQLKLNKEAIGGEAGLMQYQRLGQNFPLYEVATEMIRISDNTATNLLIQKIGGINKLNEHLKAFGLTSTKVNNFLPDLEGTNTTSTQDLVLTIAMVDSGQFLSLRSRDLFREVMSTSTTNRLLPGGLLKGLDVEKENIDYNLQIQGYRVYNKTGDIGISYADAGLIQMPDNTRAVAGFIVKGPYNDPRSAELIRQMAAAMAPTLKPQATTR